MRLDIYNKNLDRIGTIKKYECLIWRRRYYKTGAFELYLGFEDKLINLFQEDSIIHKVDDDEAGVIEYINLKKDVLGKEILVVKGRFITSILDRRIIWETENITDTYEKAMRILVDKNSVNTTDINRKFPNLQLGSLNNFTETIAYQVSYENLLSEIEKLSATSNIGFRIRFDNRNKILIFETYKGLDRTEGQSVNSRCIFSRKFNNILEQEYTKYKKDYKNVNLVAGCGEGTARKFITVGQGIGIDRYELFTDARDLSDKKTVNDQEVAIPETEYLQLLNQRGFEKLEDHKNIEIFDSKINTKSNLDYKVHYNLGDIITVIDKKWNVTVDTRITEIEETWDDKGLSLNIAFGDNIPNLIDKVRR